jgi:flavin reductase (DIM6/NTAB) family NADH-FMN oxidoreductase RutF
MRETDMKTKKIELSEITTKMDPIVGMRDKWYLVSAEKDGKVNALTAGWGAFGNVWEKKTVTVYIRPQRYTKQFMDASGRFTLTFFDGYQDALLYMGSHSGKDVPDKIEKAGLTLTHINGEPTYEEGKYMLVCRILYRQAQKPENFIDSAFAEETFPDHDYSVMYVAEIEAAYELEK